MAHRSTRDVVEDLRRGGRLVECPCEIDPNQDAAEIQRRVNASGGPAVFFPQVRGCRFSMVSNLFGTLEQSLYLFRHSWEQVRRLIELKIDPSRGFKQPWRYLSSPLSALRMLPQSVRRGPVQESNGSLSDCPNLFSWPDDGGPFVTLPQVLSRVRQSSRLMDINLGMYRVQLSGNEYLHNRECGLHYQIRRGIGVHHRHALERNESLPVAVTVGGSPAMTFAAVMPLPEGLSELTFAGALAGQRIRMIKGNHAPVYADADFAIVGHVNPQDSKPEGPFGDHLGYYSLKHSFPVLTVDHVWHRKDAIWPFTVVGRPPQEDSIFGKLIHALTGTVIPTVLPGVHAVHAVDAAGVHPLLLAIGSERFMPWLPTTAPQELLTQAHAILGQGQLALAKYLMILNHYDAPHCDIHDIPAFFDQVLRRVDWRRDLHFETRTTIDTLDYSGDGLNQGSKVVIAAAGPAIRDLPTEIPADLQLPLEWSNARLIAPGILAVRGSSLATDPQVASDQRRADEERLQHFPMTASINRFPLTVLCDDSDFTSRSFANFLWVAFTRSQPATDLYGVAASMVNKHWGCSGTLVIDARKKPHHAPELRVDPLVTKRIDALAAQGGALARFL